MNQLQLQCQLNNVGYILYKVFYKEEFKELAPCALFCHVFFQFIQKSYFIVIQKAEAGKSMNLKEKVCLWGSSQMRGRVFLNVQHNKRAPILAYLVLPKM